jgi:hypothetical protein
MLSSERHGKDNLFVVGVVGQFYRDTTTRSDGFVPTFFGISMLGMISHASSRLAPLTSIETEKL